MQLYLNTYGTYLHIKDQMFEVRIPVKDGESEKRHFAASKVSTIVLTTSSALSTDAIKLALTNNIDIVFVEADGQPLGRVWHSKLGSTTRIRKCQLQASMNELAVKWTLSWINEKITNQLDFIKDLKKHRSGISDYLDDKISRLENILVSLSQLQALKIGDIAETVRGLEGTAGRLYFETVNYVMPDQYKFNGRSSRPAKDPFNAFLNYGYGVLYSRIEKTLIVAGLDPYLGFLHRDDYNQKSMVYDFIEPYRIFIEKAVFRLFSAKKVNKAHTDEITNGYTLNKDGKVLLIEALNTFLDNETIRYKGRNLARSHAIQLDAHQFANSLIDKTEEETE